MKLKQVRAVIHVVDGATHKTEWFPLGSTQAFDAMIALVPKSGNFMVVWEEREVEAGSQTAGCDPS